jgi:hypothetical protein
VEGRKGKRNQIGRSNKEDRKEYGRNGEEDGQERIM